MAPGGHQGADRDIARDIRTKDLTGLKAGKGVGGEYKGAPGLGNGECEPFQGAMHTSLQEKKGSACAPLYTSAKKVTQPRTFQNNVETLWSLRKNQKCQGNTAVF